jgi:hypothetical protein
MVLNRQPPLHPTMKSKVTLGAGLVFGSGLCALLYQTTWLREFRLIFGSSTAASAAVLGIFMGWSWIRERAARTTRGNGENVRWRSMPAWNFSIAIALRLHPRWYR